MSSHLIRNVRILHLTGTREERALKHGTFVHELSREERRGLAFTPLSQKNQTLIKRATGSYPMAGRMAARVYEALVLGQFFKLPKEYRDRLEPFAKSSGLSLRTIWLSLYQPDFLMLLASVTGEKTRSRFLEGMPGCSTMSVNFKDSIYFLRNLDYPAANHWEKNPAVYYHEPSEPGLQKFVSVSSLGIDTAGLTGWNESGIAFSLHAHFAKKTSLSGVPIFFLGEEILENAKTLDEGIAIAEKFKTIGSWAINLTSFHEKKSVCLELSGGKLARRDSKDGVLAHANDFLDTEFQKDAIHFNESVFEDSESRRISLQTAAEKLASDFTWPKALAALGSHTDMKTGQTRVFGNAPSVVTTIQSMGFDPVEKCIYLSTRDETPTGLGPYLKLPSTYDEAALNELERTLGPGSAVHTPVSASTSDSVSSSAKTVTLGQTRLPADATAANLSAALNPSTLEVLTHFPGKVVTPDLHYTPEFVEALHFYYLAYVAWQVEGQEASVALSYLRQATEVLPSDPHLSMQRGYFELTGDQPAAALECFERALKEKLSRNLNQVALYFRGVSLDLLGQRPEAKASYQAILDFGKTDPKLEKKTRRRLKDAYSKALAKSISPDLQFAEPIDYR
jgi:predicted choloylglycine hydrolase